MFLPKFTMPARRVAALTLALTLCLQFSLGAAPASAAPNPHARPAPTDDGTPAEDVLAAVKRALRGTDIPGLSVAVLADDGREWAGTAGVRQDGKRLKVNDQLAIGSITKTFTAAIILALVDEGRIELDAPANRYLPKVRLVRDVTVRQLLNHTSGIDDLYRPTLPWLKERPGKALGSNDVLRSVGPRNFVAGTSYSYSNTNYYLLGHIIEVVTHKSFSKELASRFTGPLDLDRTRLLTADDKLMPPAWSSAFWTSGAMASTPTDLAKWGKALYGGELLSRAGMRRMLDFPAGRPYGLGTQLFSLDGRKMIGHSGLLYDTTSLLVRTEGITVALVATAPSANVFGALVGRHGGPSLIDAITRLVG